MTVRLLLDTRMVIWALNDDTRKLSREARRYIERAEAIYVSAASIFEIAIKVSNDKLDVEMDGLLYRVAAANAIELPVTWAHAQRAWDFSHPDPFDRLLIAQAEVEPLHFLTADEKLAELSSLVLLV